MYMYIRCARTATSAAAAFIKCVCIYIYQVRSCMHAYVYMYQVRSDRNLYSKNLIESQDEIAEMRRKFKIMNHQIEQLKEEIDAKDQVR